MTVDPISLAVTVALTAASMAITASQHYEGPRVQDTKATVADYGTPLNYAKGRVVKYCPCPWAEDLQDKERNSKSKNGKMTSHYAEGSWAIHVADQPIDSIARIWFDEHLVYDRDGATQTFQLTQDDDDDAFDLLDHMRFYYGTADQEPDPRIEAWTTAKYGPGTTSAWRFQSYIVFEALPLDLLGNRYPQVKVEFEAGGGPQAEIVEGLAGGNDGHSASSGYFFSSASPDGSKTVFGHGLKRNTRYLTFDNVRGAYNASEKVIDDLIPGQTYGEFALIDNAGNIYFTDDFAGFPSGAKTFKVTPGGAVTQLGTTGDMFSSLDTHFRTAALYTVDGVDTIFYDNPAFFGFESGSIYTRPTTGGPPTEHNSVDDTTHFIDTGQGAFVQGDNGDVWYAASSDGSTLEFWRVAGSASPLNYYAVADMPTMSFTDINNAPITAYNGKFYVGWGYNNPPETWLVKIDQTTFTVDSSVNVTTAAGLTPGDFTATIYYGSGAVPIDTQRNQAVFSQAGTGGGDTRIVRIDLATMALASSTVDDWPPSVNFSAWTEQPPSAEDGVYPQYSVWNDQVGGMMAVPYDFEFYPPDFAFLFMGGGVLLRDFFNDWSQRGGLLPSEYDFSDFDQPVKGFSWTQGTPKQIGAYLLDVYDCDIVPHDFLLLGKKRGSASAGTMLTSELVTDGERYSTPETNDRDLPRRIFFNFADYDADQEPNSAVAQRLAEATLSVKELSVDATALAMTASEAKQSVDRYHRRQWFGRIKPTLSLTRRRLALEPGDVMTPNFDGELLTCRLTKMTVGANGITKTEWERDDPALNALSGAEGAPAAGHVPSTIFDPAGTIADVLDLPLLTDADDQSAPFAYVVAGPNEDKAWPGAILSQSDTGMPDSFAFNWDSVAGGNASIFGETTTALGDALPWDWDNGPALRVTIDKGTLTSASEEDLLNDGRINLCAVKNGDGWELMQFATATLVAERTYDLTKRLRGVRGTEAFVAGHDVGDEFVMLGRAKVRTLGAGEIGDTDSYIATTNGQIPSDGNAFARPFLANAHRPYSPINGTLTEDGGDLLIGATRRTRIGGATLNGQDVPLGEASESWAADIYDGATFKRTITGTSLPLSYLATDRASDAVADLRVELVQINPTLNLRGAALELTE